MTAPESRSGLDPWGQAELPEPPRPKGLQWMGVVGPGVIVLGASIGSGEYLLGPANFVRYGLTMLWVVGVAVLLQTNFNAELMRYTMATGEPAITGFMRTGRRSTIWAVVYTLLYFAQVGWPAWAGAAAGAFFFMATKRIAGPADANIVYMISVATFLVCVGILLFGKRIERTLEILNWTLVLGVLGTLAALCVAFASPARFASAAAGFLAFDTATGVFRPIPPGADWFLIGAFAAYSGAGGVINITLSNWVRDKGYGMAQASGYIPTVAGPRVRIADTGTVFTPDAEGLLRWRGWWRIVRADQWGIFFPGALLGMALPAILYTAIIPRGTELRGLAIASELARALTERAGPPLAVLLALVSVWILFKAQLDILEGMVRALTDMLWSASPRLRGWRGGDIRRVYSGVMAVVVAWGVIAIGLSQPIVLLQLAANVAGFVLSLASLHILRVNTTLLPEPLRPSRARRMTLVAMSVFYGFFVWRWLLGGLVPDPERGFLFGLARRVGMA
jgi:hypothetical protein